MQSNNARSADASASLATLVDALPHRDRVVVREMLRRRPVTRNVNVSYGETITFGERLADRVAEIGGSWGFIIGFFAFLVGWAVLNAVVLVTDAFDPYPFVFLNLILSMLAAIQAPIIMMSQNRQAAKDRLAAEHDYDVNLKAEMEIMALHEKVDALRLAEITAALERQSAEIAALRTLIASRSPPAAR